MAMFSPNVFSASQGIQPQFYRHQILGKRDSFGESICLVAWNEVPVFLETIPNINVHCRHGNQDCGFIQNMMHISSLGTMNCHRLPRQGVGCRGRVKYGFGIEKTYSRYCKAVRFRQYFIQARYCKVQDMIGITFLRL